MHAEGREPVGEEREGASCVVPGFPGGVQVDPDWPGLRVDAQGNESESRIVGDDGGSPARRRDGLRHLRVGHLDDVAVTDSGCVHGCVEKGTGPEVRGEKRERPGGQIRDADGCVSRPGVVVADVGPYREDGEGPRGKGPGRRPGDDGEIGMRNQAGLAARDPEWLELSRGLETDFEDETGIVNNDKSAETPQRGFYRQWASVVGQEIHA